MENVLVLLFTVIYKYRIRNIDILKTEYSRYFFSVWISDFTIALQERCWCIVAQRKVGNVRCNPVLNNWQHVLVL